MPLFRKIYLFLLLILLCITCKEFNVETNDFESSFRIKTIIQYDEFGEETGRDVFNYKADKLILWLWYYYEESVCTTGRKVEVVYEGDNFKATMSMKKKEIWERQRECQFTVSGGRVHERLVSRLSSPQCEECWNYVYDYTDSGILKWKEFVKNNDYTWLEYRKVEYEYDNKNLVRYKDYVNYNQTGFKLDYIKEYFIENDKVAGWQGGTYIEDLDWSPTQKVDYAYEQNNIVLKSYSVWNQELKKWNAFGSVSYKYDVHDNLIEEISSSGIRTVYEYERGKGNASLIYCDPETEPDFEPHLKSSQVFIK